MDLLDHLVRMDQLDLRVKLECLEDLVVLV